MGDDVKSLTGGHTSSGSGNLVQTSDPLQNNSRKKPLVTQLSEEGDLIYSDCSSYPASSLNLSLTSLHRSESAVSFHEDVAVAPDDVIKDADDVINDVTNEADDVTATAGDITNEPFIMVTSFGDSSPDEKKKMTESRSAPDLLNDLHSDLDIPPRSSALSDIQPSAKGHLRAASFEVQTGTESLHKGAMHLRTGSLDMDGRNKLDSGLIPPRRVNSAQGNLNNSGTGGNGNHSNQSLSPGNEVFRRPSFNGSSSGKNDDKDPKTTVECGIMGKNSLFYRKRSVSPIMDRNSESPAKLTEVEANLFITKTPDNRSHAGEYDSGSESRSDRGEATKNTHSPPDFLKVGDGYSQKSNDESSPKDLMKSGSSNGHGSDNGGKSSVSDTATPKSQKISSEKKKKGSYWYNVLSPTYKSKSEDMKRTFKEIPETERLIVDSSCALQKDILVHGRVYVTQNWVCFYANIFRWETVLTIKAKDITAITKKKKVPTATLR